jgi:hypothetical protein
MKTKQIEFDTGKTILTIDITQGRHGLVATGYVNSISIRCSSLWLGRIRDLFIETLLYACDLCPESDSGIWTKLEQDIIEALTAQSK